MPRPLDDKHKGTSEFGGATGPAGVSIKGQEALTASERLLLLYRTGTTDPEAPVDPRAWEGLDSVKWDSLEAQFPLPTDTDKHMP